LGGLAVSLLFILLAGASSFALKLGLGKDLLWGAARTIAQLYLMGFILKHIFTIQQWYLVLAVFTAMIVFAAYVAKGRVKNPGVGIYLPTLTSMLLSYIVVTVIVTSVIVKAQPWHNPVYFIPLGGMVIGNSISAIAIALERLLDELRGKRDEIELRLCLGATAEQASEVMLRNAVRAGMIPSITAMMGVGVVWIPGMMTGQLLAGAEPMVAVKYQIVVMIMLVGSTAIGSVLAVLFTRRRCFAADGRLILKK